MDKQKLPAKVVITAEISKKIEDKKAQDKKADYQGWKNYETWNCALWLDNDGGTSDDIFSQIKSGDLKSQEEVENYIKNFVEEFQPELAPSMYSDILSAGLREIDYREIAGHFWGSAEKPEIEE